MSHITQVALRIRDLSALKAAVKEHGCLWLEGKQTYEYYGQVVGDYPLPKGMTKEMAGKCSHAIKIPGVRYEIGVVQATDGQGYILAYDFYGYGHSSLHDGHKLLEKFGDGLKKLTQSYAVHVASMKAKAMGWMVQKQTLPSGAIKLCMTGAF